MKLWKEIVDSYHLWRAKRRYNELPPIFQSLAKMYEANPYTDWAAMKERNSDEL